MFDDIDIDDIDEIGGEQEFFNSDIENTAIDTSVQVGSLDLLESSSSLYEPGLESMYSGLDSSTIETSSQVDSHIILESSNSFIGLDFDNINSAESFLHHYSGSLTLEDVNDSIQSASDFFNMDTPVIVSEGWTTGVFNRDLTTVNDDVLIFNPDQLESMGITEKEGLDLVMTHENTHRALQGLETGFSNHQEELCCDYMAGVRAGLNNIDTTQMMTSLIDTTATLSHPSGELRVNAIQEGVDFATDFLNENGHAPTFDDCLEHFKSSDVYQQTPDPLALVPNINTGESEFVSFTGNNYTDAEIEHLHDKVREAESEVNALENDMENWRSKVSLNDTKENRANGNYDNAVSHFNTAKQRYNDAVSRLKAAKARYNNAT